MPHALIIDDDPGFRNAIAEVIDEFGFTVHQASSLAQARERLEGGLPDVVLLDLSLPDGSGADLVPEIAEANTRTDIVLITGNATVDSAVGALRDGVTDYLVKPLDTARLHAVLKHAKRRCDLDEEVASLRTELRELGRFGAMIGSSTEMQSVYDAVSRVAPTDAAVLIHGESGTGKELVAQTLHELSRRKEHAFVALNCGAVSPQLIESELFGHERGSFTGASKTHKGYFERAAQGTLFLDEITEMPLELQIKLLRVLETGRVTRVGAEQDLATDARIIAATNQDPNEAVKAGKLRQDLLYRLSVFPIVVPPLRKRQGDILLLAQHFLAQLNREVDGSKRFSAEAQDAIRSHAWPGNVRELKNLMERAFIMSDDTIERRHLQLVTSTATAGPTGARDPQPSTIPSPTTATALGTLDIRPGMSIAAAEQVLIISTLEACDGNKEQAAGSLGISLKTLYNRLNQYRYRTPRKRGANRNTAA